MAHRQTVGCRLILPSKKLVMTYTHSLLCSQTQWACQHRAARAPNTKARAVRTSVWLGNLHPNITEPALRRAMASFISEPIGVHGPIYNEKKGCCYAMVDFATEGDAFELLRHCAAPRNLLDPWVRAPSASSSRFSTPLIYLSSSFVMKDSSWCQGNGLPQEHCATDGS